MPLCRWLLCFALALCAAGAVQATPSHAASSATIASMAASAALAAPGADPHAVKRAVLATAEKDKRITADLAARLSRNPDLADVRVSVDAGVARLSGSVLDPATRDTAVKIAQSVDGVVTVDDGIIFTPNPSRRLQALQAKLVEQVLRVLGALPALLIAVAVFVLANLVGGVLARHLNRLRWGSANPFLNGVIARSVHGVVLLVGALVALDLLGATTLVGALLGSAGVAGVAIGFAFRDIAENYLAGLLLSLRRPFEPGDVVAIGAREGTVTGLNVRAIELTTYDGEYLRLPNALVFKDVIINYSRYPTRRFTFTLGVSLQADLSLARRLGVQAITQTPDVLAEPKPTAFIQQVGSSAVQIDFYGWVNQQRCNRQAVRSDALRRVKAALDAAGMETSPTSMMRVQLERLDEGSPQG
ncbi:MAG: mechanosensitive ion channel [Burkholderiaceae bacterium]|nr:mechanosensitive ion channel [Burkholderiaceae bacterium]